MQFLCYCYSQFSLLSSFDASFFATCGTHFFVIVISWRVVFIGYLLFHFCFASINKKSLASLLPPTLYTSFFSLIIIHKVQGLFISFGFWFVFCALWIHFFFCCYFVKNNYNLKKMSNDLCGWRLQTLIQLSGWADGGLVIQGRRKICLWFVSIVGLFCCFAGYCERILVGWFLWWNVIPAAQ
jgi:hypothetical protein